MSIMKKIKALYEKHKEVVLYLIFGVLSMILNIAVYYLFNLILGKDNYLISNLVAWIAAVIFAFFTNKLLVFRSMKMTKELLIKEALEFLGARIFTLGLEELGLWIMMDILGLGAVNFGDLITKIVTSVVVIVTNYILSKFIIFKKK